MNSADGFAEQMCRLTCLSDGLFGEAAEMDTFEAEELLRTIGIDPVAVKVALYRRFHRQAKTHWREGKPLPPLLKQALEDLRPMTALPRSEKELARQARAAVKRVIERVNALPGLLRMESNPTFSMAYRNKKELSDHDKEVLDTVADDLESESEIEAKNT